VFTYLKPIDDTSWFPKGWDDPALALECWWLVEKLTGLKADADSTAARS
jgi:hypothetical protein